MITEPIFIIGCQRTGTTLLSSILNQYSDIDIASEMHLLEPSWLHKDFVYEVNRKIGDLKIDKNIPKLIDLMYSNQLFGVFWESLNLDRKSILEQILLSDRSIKSIFKILLIQHRISNNKSRCGAKFPVHFSYIELLMEWFPDCKIIHMVRDVRGIYSSQANKYLIRHGHAKSSERMRSYPIGKKANEIIIKLKMFLFICIQFPWASKIHVRYRKLSNYKLLRYENLISNPDKTLHELCEFLGIEFKEEMLYPRVINSSFIKAYGTKKGFNKNLIYKWKEYLSPFTEKFLLVVNCVSMKRFGY